MSHSSEESLSADLLAVAEQLREERHEASALDLDRIKVRALAKATRGSGTFAPRKGRLMKRRSFLATLLVVGAVVTGGGATMAVTGQFPTASDDRPTAGASQYVSCKVLVRNNRRDEKSKKRAHRRAERRIRNPRQRKRVRRINRTDEKRQRRRHRTEEKRCRRGVDRR